MSRRYAFESHVQAPGTAAPHPTREELLAEQGLKARRRERAARARAAIQGDRRDRQ